MRRQPVPGARLQALAVAGLDFAAGLGALVIGPATHLRADGAGQRDATGSPPVGAGHAVHPGIELLGELGGQAAGFGFGPIEGHAKAGAAGAAGLAGVGGRVGVGHGAGAGCAAGAPIRAQAHLAGRRDRVGVWQQFLRRRFSEIPAWKTIAPVPARTACRPDVLPGGGWADVLPAGWRRERTRLTGGRGPRRRGRPCPAATAGGRRGAGGSGTPARRAGPGARPAGPRGPGGGR